MGAVILPAMPGFYHLPKTVNEVVDHLVGKILDTLQIEHEVGAHWDGFPKRLTEDPGLEVDG